MPLHAHSISGVPRPAAGGAQTHALFADDLVFCELSQHRMKFRSVDWQSMQLVRE
jgi:hypothetical protein